MALDAHHLEIHLKPRRLSSCVGHRNACLCPSLLPASNLELRLTPGRLSMAFPAAHQQPRAVFGTRALAYGPAGCPLAASNYLWHLDACLCPNSLPTSNLELHLTPAQLSLALLAAR